MVHDVTLCSIFPYFVNNFSNTAIEVCIKMHRFAPQYTAIIGEYANGWFLHFAKHGLLTKE